VAAKTAETIDRAITATRKNKDTNRQIQLILNEEKGMTKRTADIPLKTKAIMNTGTNG